MVKVFLRNCYSGQVMCLNLDSRRHRFTLATSRSSQYLKELFLLHFSTSLPSPPRVPRSKAAAKVRILFHPPNFFKFFFKLFFPTPSSYLLPPEPSLSRAGAKIRQTYRLFQIFYRLFFLFFHQPPATTCKTARYRETFSPRGNTREGGARHGHPNRKAGIPRGAPIEKNSNDPQASSPGKEHGTFPAAASHENQLKRGNYP